MLTWCWGASIGREREDVPQVGVKAKPGWVQEGQRAQEPGQHSGQNGLACVAWDGGEQQLLLGDQGHRRVPEDWDGPNRVWDDHRGRLLDKQDIFYKPSCCTQSLHVGGCLFEKDFSGNLPWQRHKRKGPCQMTWFLQEK